MRDLITLVTALVGAYITHRMMATRRENGFPIGIGYALLAGWGVAGGLSLGLVIS